MPFALVALTRAVDTGAPSEARTTPVTRPVAVCAVARGTASLGIRSSGAAANAVWFAPAGTTTFVAGATMTKASGTATSIAVPGNAGTYKLHVVDAHAFRAFETGLRLVKALRDLDPRSFRWRTERYEYREDFNWAACQRETDSGTEERR